MRPILFLVSAASSYRLLKFVAQQLVARSERVVFLYERGPDRLFDEINADARAMGAEAHAFEPLVDPAQRSGPVWGNHPRQLSAMALRGRAAVARLSTSGAAVGRLRELQAALASQLAAALKFFSDVQPRAIVTGEDGISAPLALMAAARDRGIRVVVIPFGYGVRRDLETALDAKASRGELVTATGPWAGLIQSHAPQWIKTGSHAGALMYEDAYIVAAESLGITLRDPWIIHGGFGDVLCVESEQMRRVYLEEGVPAARLAPTGTPYWDRMVRALDSNPDARAALRQPRRTTPGLTRILVSWPPSYHDDRGRFSEFASYREMSTTVLAWLQRQPACEVKVSLHPAVSADDRAALAAAGVAVTDDYVIEQIPQHDLFITYFSSTIRWAVAAGKPVINFDLYQLGLHVYDSAPGVARVTSLADFQRCVTRLVSSDYEFAAAAGAQIAVAEDWGVLDGRCTERIANVING